MTRLVWPARPVEADANAVATQLLRTRKSAPDLARAAATGGLAAATLIRKANRQRALAEAAMTEASTHKHKAARLDREASALLPTSPAMAGRRTAEANTHRDWVRRLWLYASRLELEARDLERRAKTRLRE